MNSNINLYVNLSNPARSSLVANGSSLFAPAVPSFILRDTPTLNIRFYNKVGSALIQADVGSGVTVDFGAKLKTEILTATAFRFFAGPMTRVDGGGGDIYWTADLNLNTTEFAAAFSTSDLVALWCEIELSEGSTRQTVAQFDANGIFDVIRGSEGATTPAVPPLPSSPAANTLLGGSSDGLSWVQRTVAQVLTLLGITGITSSNTPGQNSTVVTFLGGGSTALDGTNGVTDGSTVFTVGRFVFLNLTGIGLKCVVLKAGTQATDVTMGYVRPANYAPSTFEYVFNIIS